MRSKMMREYGSSFLLLLLIYFSDDTLMFGTSGITACLVAKYIIFALVALFLMQKKSLLRNSIVALVVLFFAFLIQSIVGGLKIGFIYNVFLLMVALTYVSNISEQTFRIDFRRVVYWLSILSLVIYFISQYLPSFLTYFPVVSNVAHNYYYYCVVSIVPEVIGMRNYGIFREPGAYMVFLNLALFFEWFSDKPSIKRIVIYILTIFTTLSTGGVIIAAFIIICGFVQKRKLSISVAVIPILILGYLYVFRDSDNVYYSSLFTKIEENTGTTIARTSSITVPLVMFSQNPFGVGPEGYNNLFPVLSMQMYGYPIDGDLTTNTFLKHLAVYGMFVFLFYFSFFIRYMRLVSNSKPIFFIMLFMLLMAFSNEDMRVSMLFNILIAYGIALKGKSERSFKKLYV